MNAGTTGTHGLALPSEPVTGRAAAGVRHLVALWPDTVA